jgi:acyl-CoA synthetase (AMP-forming)/AMP-acid ligase II
MLDLGRTFLQSVERSPPTAALADFKRPRAYVLVREMPRSPVGKILRRKLVAGEYELDI